MSAAKLRSEILAVVLSHNGLTCTGIAQKVGKSHKTVYDHLRALRELGQIDTEASNYHKTLLYVRPPHRRTAKKSVQAKSRRELLNEHFAKHRARVKSTKEQVREAYYAKNQA